MGVIHAWSFNPNGHCVWDVAAMEMMLQEWKELVNEHLLFDHGVDSGGTLVYSSSKVLVQPAACRGRGGGAMAPGADQTRRQN